ncbi:MAG: TRAP transporter substrate-binding protein DctP [Chromatiales bacterium]|nr:TRAP transporter substrate-binding protein DctP [Chromatiales bacterium]
MDVFRQRPRGSRASSCAITTSSTSPAATPGRRWAAGSGSEIKSLADLNGLKMRIPGLGGQILAQLGAVPQTIAGGDIYPALERGAIDATEWVGPYDDEKLGFHKVAKHYYYPGWWEGGPQLSFYVNLKHWQALPPAYQAAFEAAAAEANVRMLSDYDARNPPALQRLLKAGVQLHAFPKDVMLAARKAAFEMFEAEARRQRRVPAHLRRLEEVRR